MKINTWGDSVAIWGNKNQMKRDILIVILIMFGTLVILDSTFLHNGLKTH